MKTAAGAEPLGSTPGTTYEGEGTFVGLPASEFRYAASPLRHIRWRVLAGARLAAEPERRADSVLKASRKTQDCSRQITHLICPWEALNPLGGAGKPHQEGEIRVPRGETKAHMDFRF